MAMQFIPRDADIARGDVVTTSGLEGIIPEGLLLGTITEVVDMASAPFKRALVEPLADPLEWSNVLILSPMSEDL
jgi:rod shape-determining protein MreC